MNVNEVKLKSRIQAVLSEVLYAYLPDEKREHMIAMLTSAILEEFRLIDEGN